MSLTLSLILSLTLKPLSFFPSSPAHRPETRRPIANAMGKSSFLSPLPLPSTAAPLPPPDTTSTHASARLPIELWREILVLATHVLSGYDTTYISPFELSEITNGYGIFLKRLKEAHRVKQALCLVSRTFRSLSQELLFEYIFLQNTFPWTKLAEALEVSKSKQSTHGGHGFGWYVKRIEISLQCWTPELGTAAARIIRCCPNLRVLTVGAVDESVGVPMEFIEAIFESCLRLRSLDWACDIGTSQAVEVLCRISRLEKLQSVFICVQHHIKLKEVETFRASERAYLPELHTVELVSPDFDPSATLKRMSTWELPSLRQVVLNGQSDLKDAYSFFDAHGPKLSTLEFDFGGESNEAPVSPPGLPQGGPEMLFTRCPNLKDLILHVHWAGTQAKPGHPMIERIGLRGLHLHIPSTQSRGRGRLALRQEYDAEQRAILEALKEAFPVLIDRARFPSIKAVRLMDFDQSRFRSVPWRSRSIAFWAFWVKRFERLGIRLEDHAGNVIGLVFREINILLPEDERDEVAQDS